MIHIININEITVFRFILLALLRYDLRIFKVDPHFPPARRILEAVASWGLKNGRAKHLIEMFPDLKPDWEYPTQGLRHDTFRKIEPWQNQAFGFEGAEETDPDYGRAYKHVTCKYFWWKYPDIFLLDCIRKELAAGSYTIKGVSSDTVGLYGAYFKEHPCPVARFPWAPTRVFNLVTGIFLAVYSVAAVLMRLRPGATPDKVFLAADYYKDPRDLLLYDELKDGGRIVPVLRGKSFSMSEKEGLKNYQYCTSDSGVFGVLSALSTIAMILRDGTFIFVNYGHRHPRHYYDLATMPYRRALIRGLFNRIRPRYFWGRDDYQVEHIIRCQEVHRIGGKSYGISHSLHGICILVPAWRYITFDVYYVLSKRLSEYFADTWPKDMIVRVVGGFAFSRKQLTTPRPAGDAIVFMSRYDVGNQEYVRMVRSAAKAFPDRTILLQVKLGYSHASLVPDFVNACQKDRPNVVYTKENVYDLIMRAAFVLSDASTIVAESIQLGVPTFLLDVVADHETCVYREFPGLCVDDAETLVEKLKAIDSGKELYPRESFSDLIYLSKNIIFDVIRQDMGLPSLGDEVLIADT